MIGSRSWPVFGLVIMLIVVLVIYVTRKKFSLKQVLYSSIVTLIVITII
ncbi:hypothetical protein KBC03_04725 [Patescibacteria group bacterium]|nr:hypothetical protein [Patescibacteria group bacterium]